MKIKQLKELIQHMDDEASIKIYGIDNRDDSHYLTIHKWERKQGNLNLAVSGVDFKKAMQYYQDRKSGRTW